MAYLEGKNLVASYGVVPILHECSVEVEKGELAVIVGPNGAGKSTVMRVLLGMLEASSGSVTLEGNDISMLSTQDRISKGLAFVPQTKNVFPSMTVEENPRLCGWGAEISSLITEHCFSNLKGPVTRITTPHVPLPSADILEDNTIPSVDLIVNKVIKKIKGE